MSTRQIRRLLREREKKDDADDSVPITSPIVQVNRPKSSFAAYRELVDSSEDSSSDTQSADEDSASENSDELDSEQEYRDNVTIALNDDTLESDSDSDDALLESFIAKQPKPVDIDSHGETNKLDCLRIDPRSFRIPGLQMDTRSSARMRLSKGMIGSLQSRNWLVPGIPPKVADKLRTIIPRDIRIKGSVDAKTKRERFVVEFSDRYKNVQEMCLMAVDSQDPGLLRRILDANPQHIEVLLRASCISTLQGHHEDAFTFLFSAVQYIQAAFPPRFSPWRIDESGFSNVWLPSTVNSNLIVYRLLILYMISLERQGQWEVSLAICKLLLLLDFPSDISHALLHIDMYIMNTSGIGLYPFSVAYARALEYSVPLHWILPNFAFGVAMDYATKEKVDTIEIPATDSDLQMIKQFLTLEESKLGVRFHPGEQDTEQYGSRRAQLYLLRAILQYPGIISLLSKEPFASELAVYTHTEPFITWCSDVYKSDTMLLKCYLKKTCDIWRNESLFLLNQTANLIVDIYRTEDGAGILDAFRDLWLSFRLDIKLPFDTEDIIVAEFDLASHSLPIALQ
ncbi:Transcriptional repressor TCF25 family protein [Babesia bovis T2Bo]|uniref:Transcription factor 25 n=1 Tax=Babesia bovis TaxID=5865 RepID=A7AQ78_BABBO|nr:Transcriptional repressor TCF25 family protein [Babesia bovis T2Bo]EDO08712.1 Transcriptional repressor TCF25 family protein [Babesia bovis T2Bo]|eukprot:XP_001612280.1 hypothetical protein [Babesia bovis T2Bo]